MIQQGHRYNYEGHSVLAMESASRGVVRCRRIRPDLFMGLSESTMLLEADKLKPEPLRYLHGQTADGK